MPGVTPHAAPGTRPAPAVAPHPGGVTRAGGRDGRAAGAVGAGYRGDGAGLKVGPGGGSVGARASVRGAGDSRCPPIHTPTDTPISAQETASTTNGASGSRVGISGTATGGDATGGGTSGGGAAGDREAMDDGGPAGSSVAFGSTGSPHTGHARGAAPPPLCGSAPPQLLQLVPVDPLIRSCTPTSL
jgi:hypothetical protein